RHFGVIGVGRIIAPDRHVALLARGFARHLRVDRAAGHGEVIVAAALVAAEHAGLGRLDVGLGHAAGELLALHHLVLHRLRHFGRHLVHARHVEIGDGDLAVPMARRDEAAGPLGRGNLVRDFLDRGILDRDRGPGIAG
ncbi:hypothetical protein QU38_00975, partial [Staphylococcus aureus]